MSESRAFCPKCGDHIERSLTDTSISETSSADGRTDLCLSCYLESFELIDAPDRVDVDVCATCGAVHRGNRWVDVGAQDYTDVAIEEVTDSLGVHVDTDELSWHVEPEHVDPTTIRMYCRFTGIVRDETVEEEVDVDVRIAKGTCTRCGRIAGDYYASTVQVRAAERSPDSDEIERAKAIANRIVADMEATGNRDAFISNISEHGDGVDIKVSTTNIGKQIASKLVDEFGGSVSDSETLITEDEDGNAVYRVTFAVRLPPFRPGDVIVPADTDDPILVTSVHGNLKGISVRSGDPYEADYRDGDAPDATRIGNASDAEETAVVTVEDEHAIQILDPETSEAITVARPSYVPESPSIVPALKSHRGVFILPDDG